MKEVIANRFNLGSEVNEEENSMSIRRRRRHKLVTRGNTSYQIQESNMQVTESMQFRRLLLPAFIALGLTSALVNIESFINLIFVSEGFVDLAPEAQSITYSMCEILCSLWKRVVFVDMDRFHINLTSERKPWIIL